MHKFALLMLLACSSLNAADWSPPANPDPQAILREARKDANEMLYSIALAKHVWFHEKALEFAPDMYGVRLSFALADWYSLAKLYPPAMKRLVETRDQALQNVMEGKKSREFFHDMAAINQVLKETDATSNTFKKLDQSNPKAAGELFLLAKPALVRAKAYDLIGKYIQPEQDLARMIRGYELGMKFAKTSKFAENQIDFHHKSFANDATTLVAILVVTKREDEAKKIAEATRRVWDDAEFHAAIEKALKGEVPEPWPSM